MDPSTNFENLGLEMTVQNPPSFPAEKPSENRVLVSTGGELWQGTSSFPPSAGELLEGDERAQNPQALESFGERWLRLHGSAMENDREETRFPGFESRVGSFLENVAEEVRFPGYSCSSC